MVGVWVAYPDALLGMLALARRRYGVWQVSGKGQDCQGVILFEFYLGAQAVFGQGLDQGLALARRCQQQVIVTVAQHPYADQAATLQAEVHAGEVSAFIHLPQVTGQLPLQIVARLFAMGANHRQVRRGGQVRGVGNRCQGLRGKKSGPAHGTPVDQNADEYREFSRHDR